FSLRAEGATPWLPNWLTKQFIAARRAAGLPHFRLHDLRHFMATQMLAVGVPMQRFPSGSATLGPPRRSTSTHTRFLAVTEERLKCWQQSWPLGANEPEAKSSRSSGSKGADACR
ncbi:MAG: hypothetical protein ACRDH5_04600, partial [bacterium]